MSIIDDLEPKDQGAKSIIESAIAKLGENAGAVFEPEILELLQTVRGESPADWMRYRQAIKATNAVPMAELDKHTTPIAGDDEDSGMFPPVTPWSEPVDGAQLLDDMTAAIKRHVIAEDETLRMAAVWCAFTWFLDVVTVSPIANITAPEMRCGKSVLLSAISKLSYKPISASSISAAALYRSVELWRPTLLIDEADSFLKDNEDLRGIINSGFDKASAGVVKCDGDDNEPRLFSTWCAKVLCGIGAIAATMQDRSIPLVLRRKLLHETTENIRHAAPALFDDLRRKLSRWADDNREVIGLARPATIAGLNDRANDCMEPLLAITECAGGHWSATTRSDAINLFDLAESDPSVGVQLLQSIKAAFIKEDKSVLGTAQLLEALCDEVEDPWATWNRGKEMTARQFASRLKEFKIKPQNVGPKGKRAKGYQLDQFKDAFKRYIPAPAPLFGAAPPNLSVHPYTSSNGAGYSETLAVHREAGCTDRNQPHPAPTVKVNGCADRNPYPPAKEKPKPDEADNSYDECL